MFKRLLVLLVVLHAYLAWRLLPAWPAGGGQLWLGLWLCLSLVLIPLGLVHRRLAGPPWANRLAWLGFVALGLFGLLLALTLLRDAALGMWQALAWAGWAQPAAAHDALRSAQAVPLLALALGLVGVYLARRTPPVRRVRIALPHLAPALQGLTIAQISDVHVGPTLRHDFVARLVERVNALDADLIAVTGDLVDGPVDELLPHIEPLGRLRARHGVFFVTGNHEYYAGCHPWLPVFERLGMRVLLNAHEVIERQAGRQRATLVLAGVTDWSAHRFDVTHRSDPQAALVGAPERADLRLLLAHQPRSAAAAEKAGFDLQLSGHTHGGQLWPWMYLVRLQQPFRAGLRRHGRLWVYTNRGAGYWGPPMRLGALSELSLITLEAAPLPASGPGRRGPR